MPDPTRLETAHLDHMTPQRAPYSRPCQICGTNTKWYCPGCRKADNCGAKSGHYCLGNDNDCWGSNHRRRARCVTRKRPAEEEAEGEAGGEDEDEE